MRLVSRSLLVAGLSTLAACGSGGTLPGGGGSPSGVQLAGKYNGSFLITRTTPFVNVDTTLTLDAAGNLVGTTTSRDRTPVDIGIIKGTVTGSDALSLDFDLQFESTAFGKYTITGKGYYLGADKILQGTFTAKNATGTYIGDVAFGVKGE